MAQRGRPTLQKRQRERARVEKQKDREARKEVAKERRANAPDRSGAIDPDIAHIAAGPQPMPEWQAEVFAEAEAAAEAEAEAKPATGEKPDA
ncbi:MAG: hypothetical protein QGF21_00780 [Vicinamibacterales bacterium]|jgi:hypothetical protein|nr:hypothetical protein [Vicinamibacterales bacterium]MDP7471028.1 hypothetical protein [Vicinamibacterales bacterium]MDP7670460.1 hypothetical protein [Vicinamibacterales bacterium]HJO38118.1 hypothetical protein [Vicinamibacterales bacterium]|tara:strand:- start:6922 stop:7197 length:276 start_codon:yes stop_codon:yes gene_type:complete